MEITAEKVEQAVKDYEVAIKSGAKPIQIVATLFPATDKGGVDWKIECVNPPDETQPILVAFAAIIKISIEKAVNPKAYGID